MLQTRNVTDPAGDRYRISIRWLPWKLRRRSMDDGSLDAAGNAAFGSDDLLGGIGVFLIVLVLLVVAVPALLFGIELVALLFVILLGLLLSAVGLRRLTVEVERVTDAGDVRVCERRCRGIRNAERELRRLAEAAELGELPAPAGVPEQT